MQISSLLLILMVCKTNAATSARPHIVMIVADDLGWYDIGWQNPAMHTPTLDRLAAEGVKLNFSYVQPSCSPSRSALMSGRYPFHLGLQHETIAAGHRYFLPDNQPILPQALQSLGYVTHAVGKWHLGFCNWRYTPTYRGFNSFYGYYNAEEDYYNKTGHRDGYDFRDNEDVDWTAHGHYSTHLYADRASKIIREHNASQPLFLYLAFQAVHGQLQVPESYVDRFCSHIPDRDRQLKCGMVAAMDEAVTNVTATLQASDLASNTLIIFTSDNGGPVKMGSSNWPLRGSKITIWEGGTRALGFVHGPNILLRSGYTYDELIHIVDWYPTLVEAAGGSAVPNIDGMSQWQNLLTGGNGPRQEFVYNIDEVDNNAAIRQGRFKLVQGHAGSPDGWYAPPELPNTVTTEPSRNDRQDYMLFNLNRDPEEQNNIIDSHQDVFNQLRSRLDEYRSSIVHSVSLPFVNEANPVHFNGVWSPGWC